MGGKVQPTIDLDELGAARAEARGERKPPTIRYKGRVFELVPAIPFEMVIAFSEIDSANVFTQAKSVANIAKELLGDAWDDFRSTDPEMDDVLALISLAFSAYSQADAGESLASSAPSEDTGASSRPRSRVDTPESDSSES